MHFYSSRKKGFTLIELIVAAAIIGILASIVMASLNEARKKARDAQRMSDLQQVQLALRQYKDVHGRYPDYPNGVRISYMQREDVNDPTQNGELLKFFSKVLVDPFDTAYPYSDLAPTDMRDGKSYMYIYDSSYKCLQDNVFHSILVALTMEVDTNANMQSVCAGDGGGVFFGDQVSTFDLSRIIILK